MKKEQKQNQKKNQPNQKHNDPFFRIKNIAYNISQLPSTITLADFIRFAKFQICQKKKMLYYDPIWDKYADEQILVEYYAILFDEDKTAREDFEVKANISSEYEAEWMDQAIEKNKKELKNEKTDDVDLIDEEDLIDGFDETPKTLGR